ncbi:MAG: hypothetical protein HC900_05735, partial [Methylacidiphilales bacterium]|nr:hypothetical protein [Candidatus Methylacidiphilales bacterium]
MDPDTVANPTDPDSNIMKTRRGWVQGDNAQIVVTPDQIILAAEVTTDANDVHQLATMLDHAQANVAAVIGEDAELGAAVAMPATGRRPTRPARPKSASCSSPPSRTTSSGPTCAPRRRPAAGCQTACRPEP